MANAEMNLEMVIDTSGLQEVQNMLDKKDRMIKELVTNCTEYEEIIHYCHTSCMCERFNTKGFDYHEKHARLKDKRGGVRHKTPRDVIEDWLRFDWAYKHPTKGGNSIKRIWFRFFKPEEYKGYKTDKEWKELHDKAKS